MTTDRDIRLSVKQIKVLQFALRDEVKKRTRSIDKAEAARAAGATVKHGTLQEHYEARAEARAVLTVLDVALRQIDHLNARDPKWEQAEFPTIGDTEREQLLDRRIQARLSTDAAYRNAANAQQQAERERVIEDEECQRLDRQQGEAHARRAV